MSCPGGYRLGSRFFRCDAVHGSVDMPGAIEHSCNTYFWSMVHRVGYDKIAPIAKMLGLGVEFDLPGTNQRYGTIPDSAWKMRRYKQEWTAADGLNASIGQGYVSVNPLQLAVMTARVATGRDLQPTLLFIILTRQFIVADSAHRIGSCLCNFFECALLKPRNAFHHIHQVGNKIDPALVSTLYFGPLQFYLLFFFYQSIVGSE